VGVAVLLAVQRVTWQVPVGYWPSGPGVEEKVPSLGKNQQTKRGKEEKKPNQRKREEAKN
jgi:hypothetical protein